MECISNYMKNNNVFFFIHGDGDEWCPGLNSGLWSSEIRHEGVLVHLQLQVWFFSGFFLWINCLANIKAHLNSNELWSAWGCGSFFSFFLGMWFMRKSQCEEVTKDSYFIVQIMIKLLILSDIGIVYDKRDLSKTK